MSNRPAPARSATPKARRGLHIGPLRVTPALVVVVLGLAGSLAFLAWVVLRVRDNQIPLLAAGFVALGASFTAIAVASLVGVWQAASRARGGRAFALAIFGGLAGLAAIGSFAITALLSLVWSS